MEPSSAVATTVTLKPAPAAEAALVPWALAGTRTRLRCCCPVARR